MSQFADLAPPTVPVLGTGNRGSHAYPDYRGAVVYRAFAALQEVTRVNGRESMLLRLRCCMEASSS